MGTEKEGEQKAAAPADSGDKNQKAAAADNGEEIHKVAAPADGGEKKDDVEVVSIYKLGMHCEGCAKKIRNAVKNLEGVESVKTECETNKLTITGKVDPEKVKARLEEKSKKKVDIISPQPKKDAGGGGDKKSEEKVEKKPEEKKPEEKKPPKEITVVLKVRTHCAGCITKMKKIIKKFEGVESVAIDGEKDLVTVKGTMEVEDLVPYLSGKIRRSVEVVPPKKDDGKKEGGGGGDGDQKKAEDKKDGGEAKAEKKEGGGEAKAEKKEGGGEAKAEKKEGDGGKKEAPAPAKAATPAPATGDDGEAEMKMMSRLAYFPTQPPPQWLGGVFGPDYTDPHPPPYGYYPGNEGYPIQMNNGYTAMPQGHVMEPPVYHRSFHAPQIFSDENPNACSVM